MRERGRLGDAAPRTDGIRVHSQKWGSQRRGTSRTESNHPLDAEHAIARRECCCSLVTRPPNRTGSATKVAVSLIPSLLPLILSPRLLFEAAFLFAPGTFLAAARGRRIRGSCWTSHLLLEMDSTHRYPASLERIPLIAAQPEPGPSQPDSGTGPCGNFANHLSIPWASPPFPQLATRHDHLGFVGDEEVPLDAFGKPVMRQHSCVH
jgi:hypothetical protein